MAKILVTGATGRLGANLIKRLKQEGYDVVAYVIPNDPKLGKIEPFGVEVVFGDLRDATALRQAAQGCDAVIHTAALMNERAPGVSRAEFFSINVVGTFNVFDAAADAGVNRVVYISSTSAYDVYANKPQPLREDMEPTPTALYGATKVLNERMGQLFEFMRGLRVVALRPNYIVAGTEILGPWRASTIIGAIRQWSKDPRAALYVPDVDEPWKDVEAQIQSPSDFVVPRDPQGLSWRWHVCDVRDCVQACMCALTAGEHVLGRVYNVAGPQPADFDVVVPYLAEKLGEKCYEVQVPKAWRFWFDLSRAREELGFEPQYDILRMIDDALRIRAGEDVGIIEP